MIIFWQHPNGNVCPKGGEFVDAEFDIDPDVCLRIKINSDLFKNGFGTEKIPCSFGNVINPETLQVIWDGRLFRFQEQDSCDIPDMLQLAIRYANWKQDQANKAVDKPDNT